MTQKDVKTNLLDHSEVKVRLLGEYLKRYLSIISNNAYNKSINLYDLFCGEGIYENGGEGSPFVILRSIYELHDSGLVKNIPPIDCQFNDLNKEKIKKLSKNIEEKFQLNPEYGTIKLTTNDYRNEVKKIIEQLPNIKNRETFVFIDPYSYKEISATDIKNLLKSKNSEILIFLPTQFMYRFDKNGTPEALKDFIEELTSYKEWKETSADSVWGFIEQLKEGFRNFLGSNYFVDTFTIQKEANTVFCLFFFSSHIRGFEKMLESKWKIDQEEGKGWEYTNQGSLFSIIKTNLLKEKLKEFLKTDRTNGEVYEYTLHCGFLPTHAVEVFTEWQNNGSLSVNSPTGGKVRKRAFYISYGHYRDENNKVKYNIK
jgi:three-Cys-motif partner protein